jgi:hypothetical protein
VSLELASAVVAQHNLMGLYGTSGQVGRPKQASKDSRHDVGQVRQHIDHAIDTSNHSVPFDRWHEDPFEPDMTALVRDEEGHEDGVARPWFVNAVLHSMSACCRAQQTAVARLTSEMLQDKVDDAGQILRHIQVGDLETPTGSLQDTDAAVYEGQHRSLENGGLEVQLTAAP